MHSTYLMINIIDYLNQRLHFKHYSNMFRYFVPIKIDFK